MLPLRLNSVGRFTASTACAPARALVTGARTVEAVCCGFCCNWARAGARAVETARFSCLYICARAGAPAVKSVSSARVLKMLARAGARAACFGLFVCFLLLLLLLLLFLFLLLFYFICEIL